MKRYSDLVLPACLIASFPAASADIVLTPPAGGGVAMTDAAGTTTRFRVGGDGIVTLPTLAPVPGTATGLCMEIATGKVGTCSISTLASITAGTGLSGGTITTTGTISLAGSYQLPQGCMSLQVPAYNQGLGIWTCSTPTPPTLGTVTSVATGAGLSGGPITTTGTIDLAATQLLPIAACASGDLPKWSGSAWTCATESDPKVGTLGGSGSACTSTGTQVACTGAAVTTTQVNYSAPRTGYVNIHASAFLPMSSATGYASTWGGGNDRYISSASTASQSLVASFNLPHGSTLTGFSCVVNDSSAATGADVIVGVVDAVDNFWMCLSGSTSGAPGQVTLSAGCSWTIDNTAITYYARFIVTNPSACGASCSLYGCHATYTYSTDGR